MNLSNIEAEFFICDRLTNVEDCFTMPYADDRPTQGSYETIVPKEFPNNVVIGVQEAIDMLRMYTSGLKILMAPPALCIQKSMELLDEEDIDYALTIFRYDLTQQVIESSGGDDHGFEEVDLLITGIAAMTNYLSKYFKQFGLYMGDRLAYVYDQYIEPDILVVTKFAYYDGNIKRHSAQSQPSTSPSIHLPPSVVDIVLPAFA